MPLDSDTGKQVAHTMIATYLVQYILYRVDDLVENDDSASEDRRLQFTAMLPALRWADEHWLGIALAAAVERAARLQRWLPARQRQKQRNRCFRGCIGREAQIRASRELAGSFCYPAFRTLCAHLDVR
jgi:hypothetical protein